MFKYGFSQDDFIHLWASRVDSLSDVINFFNPFAHFEDIFFYRPLATQFYFFVNSSLFGLNPLPFHIIALLVHLLNTFLFYKLVKSIWQNDLIAKVSSILYGLSAVHFLSLYYISAFQQLSKTLLIFLALLAYQKFYFVSLLYFILALLSKETAIILPVLILLFELLKNKININKLLPFFAIAGAYLLIRIAGFQSIFTEGAYEFDLSLFNVFQNLKWDLLWIWGLPEMISSLPSLRPDYLIDFAKNYQEGFWILLSLFGLGTFVLIGGLINFKKLKLFKKQILIGVIILLLPLIPTLPLKGHNYPHYLDMSLLIFLPAIVYLIKNNKLLLSSGVVLFLALQFFSYQLSERTHWATHRSEVASHYEKIVKQDIEKFNNDTTVVFVGPEDRVKEVSYALAGKYAIYVWSGKEVKDVKFQQYVPQTEENVFVYPVTKF